MPQTQELELIGPVTTEVRKAQLTLDELWSRTAIESRAYTGNIVALTKKRHLARVREALSQLGGRYAGRQIIGVMDGDENVQVEASLVPQRGLYIERLVIDASEAQLQGAILPLLRSATVNHVWWAATDPPSGALLAELAELADQVIGDTLALGIPVDRRYTLADLGWARTSGWREATAQLFDVPAAAAQLPTLSSLRVTFAGDNPRPARLFAGWIASKLGWLDLTPIQIGADPHCDRENGDLCSVRLEGDGAHFSLTAGPAFTVRAQSRYGSVDHETQSAVPPLTLGEGLGFVMARLDQNDNFLDALEVARRLS